MKAGEFELGGGFSVSNLPSIKTACSLARSHTHRFCRWWGFKESLHVYFTNCSKLWHKKEIVAPSPTEETDLELWDHRQERKWGWIWVEEEKKIGSFPATVPTMILPKVVLVQSFRKDCSHSSLWAQSFLKNFTKTTLGRIIVEPGKPQDGWP